MIEKQRLLVETQITEVTQVIEIQIETVEVSITSEYNTKTQGLKEVQKVNTEKLSNSKKHTKVLKKNLVKAKENLKNALFSNDQDTIFKIKTYYESIKSEMSTEFTKIETYKTQISELGPKILISKANTVNKFDKFQKATYKKAIKEKKTRNCQINMKVDVF